MRFPATTLLSAAFLLMSACGSWDDLPPPPPEFYELEISCPTCREAGVDTLRIHDLSGVRTIVLESSGRASTTSSGSSVQEEATWFSSRSGPMMVASVQEHQTEVEVELLPMDWGQSPFEDTLLVRRVVDPDPESLSLEIRAFVRSGEALYGAPAFNFNRYDTLRLLPDDGGTVTFRVPKLLARRNSSLLVEDHRIQYRRMPFRLASLADSFPTISWPPATNPTWEVVGRWSDSPELGTTRLTELTLRSDGRRNFHRTMLRGMDRLWEDSGSWDSADGMARFVRRGPGLPEVRDSFTFQPRRVIGAIGTVWWWVDSPVLQGVATVQRRPLDWKYFPKP